MAQVIVKLDTAEFEQLCRAAEFYGKDVTAFMREAALRAAQLPWVRMQEPIPR